jgi:hypothetical protein
MSHRNLEVVIGRLVTDEELLRRFLTAPEDTLCALAAEGLELTPVELPSLAASAGPAWQALACSLDARLRKASLAPPEPPKRQVNPRRRGRTS